MSWKLVMQRYWMVGHPDHSSNSQPATPASEQGQATRTGRSSERVRSWRRRVLLKRGAHLRATMGLEGRTSTLAMLDETGVVVAWYGRDVSWHDRADDDRNRVLDRHVSVFYVPEDVASKRPSRDLHAATLDGRNSWEGWRRRADGTVFWGTAVIEAIVLRGGQLQGFSYLTSSSQGPQANVPVARCLTLPCDEESEESRLGVPPPPFLPARDRMARSRSAARQRRLFRLAWRLRLPQHEPMSRAHSASTL